MCLHGQNNQMTAQEFKRLEIVCSMGSNCFTF